MVQHIQPKTIHKICQILVDECQYDKIDNASIIEFFAYDINAIFHPSKDNYFQRTVHQLWFESYPQFILSCPKMPKQLDDFWTIFINTMQQHGFYQANIANYIV